MLGDTAVCVHPSDERYKHLIGQQVTVPLVNRDIPIIADALLADPTLGTGCVKVTPAHDPNDYQTGLRHKLEKKASKVTRRLSGTTEVAAVDVKRIKKLLGR